MKLFVRAALTLLISIVALGCGHAAETENQGLSVLPTPGTVTIDGKYNDWDMTGGIFSSSSPETQRDTYSTWTYAMYDAKNLYLLVRWADQTPLDNPGQTIADYGFSGDCFQVRFTLFPGTPEERTSHWTCWKGADGKDLMDIAYGKRFNEGSIRNAKTLGANQAFTVNPDGKGYTQEIAIPWALLTKDGSGPPKTGDKFNMAIEPNWTVGIGGRWSVKDIFKPGETPDRVFTFQANNKWGPATLEAHGKIAPPPVRLADGRIFPVKMENGLEVVDWTGLIKTPERKGFKKIAFTMPDDGYVSLNIYDANGVVARQLINNDFYSKGPQSVLWDGLTTPNWHQPGDPVADGSYTWRAIWHKAIGLKLRGWADNGGRTPWDDGPTTNWGGDEGIPSAAASDATHVYLGWTQAEAGKALLALDLNGNVLWHNNRKGIAGANLIAVDKGIVYASNSGDIYRVAADTGKYVSFTGTDSPDVDVNTFFPDPKTAPKPDAIAVGDGKLYLAFTKDNSVWVFDSDTGKRLKTITVPGARAVAVSPTGAVDVITDGTQIATLDVAAGSVRPIVTGLVNATALTFDAAGKMYVGLGAPDNQVKVYTADGKLAQTIGRTGGRPLLGKWNSDGMAYIKALTVASDGKLWVAEENEWPKRVSVWDTKTGAFVKEYFGPTTYGALGGAIDPLDPNVMVGQGCEWKLDPATGKAACVSVITNEGMSNSRFAVGSNGRLYLGVAPDWIHGSPYARIYERTGPGEYVLRNELDYSGKEDTAKTRVWTDSNGDGKQQDDEIAEFPGSIVFSLWYMNLGSDLSIYSKNQQFKVTGFTPCGAPKYDFAHPTQMPVAGLGSADGKLVLTQGAYGQNMTWNKCYDIASGKLLWTYPDNFVGVHGSHNAVPLTPGMIRGSYGPNGSATLPDPIGNMWMIGTNVGEWHILTQDGFYLTPLFQGDGLKVQFPKDATPGAIMDNTPPGMGGEDFGGSISYGKDGKLYIQSGKVGYWNLEVTGLDSVKKLQSGTVAIVPAEMKLAREFHDSYAQEAVGVAHVNISAATPTFTGNLAADFKDAQVLDYQKSSDAVVKTASAWDDKNLYVAWDVKDSTPWANSAGDPAQMYIGGDTVDLQLGANPASNRNRGEPVAGDLRLSIGSYQGTPTAVLYRKVSTDKKPMVFSSGVVKSYPMDYVSVLTDVTIKLKVRANSGYVVEAAIPLSDLGIAPTDGLTVTGDFGATYGDPAGQRTRLRTYWSNQHTGIVDDAVFELQMEPKNWGEIEFKK